MSLTGVTGKPDHGRGLWGQQQSLLTRLRVEVGAQQLIAEQWSRDEELRMTQPAGKGREELSRRRVQNARVQGWEELPRAEHDDPLREDPESTSVNPSPELAGQS